MIGHACLRHLVANEHATAERNIEAERELWRKAAEQALYGERQRISISIPRRDLLRLKTRAAEQGMPYQTLINSILHKYVES